MKRAKKQGKARRRVRPSRLRRTARHLRQVRRRVSKATRGVLANPMAQAALAAGGATHAMAVGGQSQMGFLQRLLSREPTPAPKGWREQLQAHRQALKVSAPAAAFAGLGAGAAQLGHHLTTKPLTRKQKLELEKAKRRALRLSKKKPQPIGRSRSEKVARGLAIGGLVGLGGLAAGGAYRAYRKGRATAAPIPSRLQLPYVRHQG